MSTTRRLTAGLFIGVACAVVGAMSIAPVLTAAATCESLASLAFPDAKITVAEPVAAGSFSQPGAAQQNAAFKQLPAFCRVAATLQPSHESDIKIEVWLPASGLERETPDGRQRRLGGIVELRRDGGRTEARVCHELHRQRPSGRRRPLDGESGEAHRLRISVRPRDGGEEQGRGGVVLRNAVPGSRTSMAARAADDRGSWKRSASPATSTASSPARRL